MEGPYPTTRTGKGSDDGKQLCRLPGPLRGNRRAAGGTPWCPHLKTPGDCSQQRPPRLTQQRGDACALTHACTYTHRHSSPLTGLLVRAALTLGDAGLPELPPASSWSMPPPTGAQVDGYLPARLFLAETHRLFSEAGGNEVDSCTPFPGGGGGLLHPQNQPRRAWAEVSPGHRSRVSHSLHKS